MHNYILRKLMFDYGLIAAYNINDIESVKVETSTHNIYLSIEVKNKVLRFEKEGVQGKWHTSQKP